jgi:hypothetical protein
MMRLALGQDGDHQSELSLTRSPGSGHREGIRPDSGRKPAAGEARMCRAWVTPGTGSIGAMR